MLETILLIPFIVVAIFFIYQAYITTNKVQIAQKYLKTYVVGMLLNRFEVTVEQKSGKNTGRKTPTDGQYFFVYDDFNGDDPAMNAGLDDATTGILLTFMTKQGDKAALEARLTKGQKSKQATGICLGGRSLMKEQVSTDVLSMADGATCGK